MSTFKLLQAAVFFAFSLTVTPVLAATKVAVLPFELVDETRYTVPEEIARTASLAPAVKKSLSSRGDYEFTEVSPDELQWASTAYGYLMNHADEAVKLGKQLGVDWIVVGENHKVSFLVTYAITHLVNVKNGTLAGHFQRELKGSLYNQTLTDNSAAELGQDIHTRINSPNN